VKCFGNTVKSIEISTTSGIPRIKAKMSGLKSTRRMPTRVTIAGRMGGFAAPRRQRPIKERQRVRSSATTSSTASTRRVDWMKKKYVVKQRKMVNQQENIRSKVTIHPRVQIRTKRQTSGSPENPPAAPVKKRRISVISNNITKRMMIQVERTPSVVSNLHIPSKYAQLEHVPKRNVVRRSDMKRFTINQSVERSSQATNHDIPHSKVTTKKVYNEKHVFTKVRKPSSRAQAKRKPKVRGRPTTSLTVKAPDAEEDNSSVYSYSSDDSVSEDENRRSKKNLGPVMKSTTVTRGGHIMLRNLPKEINARMLMMELFRDDGDVINAIVHSDDKGVQLGTGEVVFAKRKEAHYAIVRHCGSVWRGKKIKMTMIGQMIEQPVAKIMSRRERRRKAIRKKRNESSRSAKGWDVVAPPVQNEMSVNQLPVEEKVDLLGVVEEPGGDEEGHSMLMPIDEPYQEETINQEIEHQDDTLSKAMDRNGLVVDAGTQFSNRVDHKPSEASLKRKKQFEYIPAGKEDNTGYHVTLKNMQQYTYLNELTDSDEGDQHFLRSS